MLQTILNVEIPEYVDDYATDCAIPLNVVASVDMFSVSGINTVLTVRSGERVSSFHVPTTPGKLRVPLPLETQMEPGVRKVVFDLADNGQSVIALRKTINTTGASRIWVESPDLGDSLFARMGPACDSMLVDIKSSEILQYMRPWRGNHNPSATDAYNFIENMLEFFTEFEYVGMSEPERGLQKYITVADALETRKADAITFGLMFGHVALKMNYKPVMILYRDTCLIGLEVFDFDSPVELREVSVEDPALVSVQNRSGIFLLADVSELTSMDDSIRAATMQFDNHIPVGTCIGAWEVDKERYVRENYYSGRGQRTDGWEN